MNKEELESFARKAAKTIKSEKDLNGFRQMLTKVTVETALNAELDDHLGYDKHSLSDQSNNRNGRSKKTLRTEDGSFNISTPRDREGSFEPELVKKHHTRFTSMDDKILSLYCEGHEYSRDCCNLQRNVWRGCFSKFNLKSDRCHFKLTISRYFMVIQYKTDFLLISSKMKALIYIQVGPEIHLVPKIETPRHQ